MTPRETAEQTNHAPGGDPKRLDEAEALVSAYGAEQAIYAALEDGATAIMRERYHAAFGINCTFVDDEMAVLCALGQRAILAGLAADADAGFKRCAAPLAEEPRAGHETAPGFPIPQAGPAPAQP